MQDNLLYNYSDPTLQGTNVGFCGLVRQMDYIESYKVKNMSNLMIRKMSRSELETFAEELICYISELKDRK